MNRHIIFLSMLISVVTLLLNIQVIIVNGSNNIMLTSNNCSSGIILLNAINETIENITNTTSKKILYRIEELLGKLDCNVLEQIVQRMYLNQAKGETRQYYNIINYRKEEYTRLDNGTNINNRVVSDDYKNYIVAKNVSSNAVRKQNNRIDPLLVVVNIVSIVSFAIGVYLFRIIKKRMDYI